MEMNFEKPSKKDQIRITQKIAEIAAYEDDIPGVIILTNGRTFNVEYMSKRGREILKITNEELTALGNDYYKRFFNAEESADYVPKIFDYIHENDHFEYLTVLQQVRPSPEYNFTWYITGVKIILWDDAGLPLLLMSLAMPIDAMHELARKAQRVLDENNFLKKNFLQFDTLTKREKEILTLFAKGYSNDYVAKQLFISVETVATHRKNIKKKLQIKSNYDLTHFAQAFDLI